MSTLFYSVSAWAVRFVLVCSLSATLLAMTKQPPSPVMPISGIDQPSLISPVGFSPVADSLFFTMPSGSTGGELEVYDMVTGSLVYSDYALSCSNCSIPLPASLVYGRYSWRVRSLNGMGSFTGWVSSTFYIPNYPVMMLALIILLVSPHRMLFLLFALLCVVVAGFDGVAVAVTYWLIFEIVAIPVDFFRLPELLHHQKRREL